VTSSERATPATVANVGRLTQDSVSLEVSKVLLGLVVSGDIPTGSRLPSERDLSAQLGVPRNAIRDGLRPLTLLGLLESRAGSGTYVKSTTSDLLPEIVEWGLLLEAPTLVEVIEARPFVEVALSQLAAQRRDNKGLRALKSSLVKMATAETPEEFSDAELAFHLRLADEARNHVLASMLRTTRPLLAVWIRRVVAAERDRTTLYAEHEAIFDAIKAGDPTGAGAAMERHLTKMTELLKAGLEAEREAQTEGNNPRTEPATTEGLQAWVRNVHNLPETRSLR
jgi:GntR family transcriptional regulator, transcriptional repressor for pyruvate dehydrogenase complex